MSTKIVISAAIILLCSTIGSLLNLVGVIEFMKKYIPNLRITEEYSLSKAIYFAFIHMDRVGTGDEIKNVIAVDHIFNLMLLILIFRNRYIVGNKKNFFSGFILAFSSIALGTSAMLAVTLFTEMFYFYEVEGHSSEKRNYTATFLDNLFTILFILSTIHFFSLPPALDPTKIVEDQYPSSFRLVVIVYALFTSINGLEFKNTKFDFSQLILPKSAVQ